MLSLMGNQASVALAARAGARRTLMSASRPLHMKELAPGVAFDKIAREWRCKWSPESDKASLVNAQKALDEVLGEVKAVPGVVSVQRAVCGGCMDFKVITQLDGESFGKWSEAKFKPEEAFLEKLKAIDGISTVETQTMTLMPM